MKNKPSLADIEEFNRNRAQELELEPDMLGEDAGIPEIQDAPESSAELLQTVRMQKHIIDKISRELTRALEQVKAQRKILDENGREIALLREKLDVALRHRGEDGSKPRRADQSYNKELILRNIVTLIEEKGFSYNDVARLFRLEGFLPPSPHANWNDKVVEQLYATAR